MDVISTRSSLAEGYSLLSRNISRREHHKSTNHNTVGIVVGVVVGVLVILGLLIFWAYWSRKKKSESNPPAAEVPLATRLGSHSPGEYSEIRTPLYNDDGKLEANAQVVHQGQAGYSYMSYISQNQNQQNGQR